MSILRYWRTDPPDPEPTTLSELVADWRWRKRKDPGLRDQITPWCRAAPNYPVAARRATESRLPSGKMWYHQSRVSPRARRQLFARLLAEEVAVRASSTFEELHARIEGWRVPGIGPITAYDVAVRVGAYLRLAPRHVYLHGGARAGAAALGLSGERVERRQLPKPMRRMPADDAEDFLCYYRDLFGGVDLTR